MTEEQKETEFISGVIEGIIQKAVDKWQVAVKPDGSQYAKNLWTKDGELVTALTAKIGSQGAFVCGVSHWTNNEGKSIRSLWINEVGDSSNPPSSVATPATQAQADAFVKSGKDATNYKTASDGMTPEKWDAKERRDYRSRAWAQTIAAFTHTIKTDEDPEEVFDRLQVFQRKVFQDVCQSFAFPGDESDVPF